MSNPQTIPMFRRGYRLQWEEVQNRHVILYPEGLATLNDSATALLNYNKASYNETTTIASRL